MLNFSWESTLVQKFLSSLSIRPLNQPTTTNFRELNKARRYLNEYAVGRMDFKKYSILIELKKIVQNFGSIGQTLTVAQGRRSLCTFIY